MRKKASKQNKKERSVVQCRVPMNDDDKVKHPTPNTGTYKARRNDDIYSKEKYPRSKFFFGDYTRNEVLSKYPHSKIGNRIIAVRDDASGQMVNVEGVHLDHIFSWENIAKIMDDAKNFTVSEARMYYNDQDNLHPVLGGLNSFAGGNGVAVLETKYPQINAAIATTQTSWMNLQNFVTARMQEMNFNPDALLKHILSINSLINSYRDDW